MTRDTIKEFFMQIENAPEHSNRWKPELVCEMIDQIFDDLESRTCENCAFNKGCQIVIVCEDWKLDYKKVNLNCSKWEQR